MKKLLLATTAIACTLFAGVAVVKADDVTTTSSASSSTALNANDMIGRTVVNTNNDKVGDVESVLIDKEGKVRYVVIGVGGFLGMGEKDVAMRWDQLSFADNNQKIIVNTTKEQLTALPAHRYSDPSWKGKVYAYDDDLKSNPYLADNSTSAEPTPPLPGANSFTESQARDRIEANGYSDVTGLRKDDDSIWRGIAMKDGQSVKVALDYKGNVVAQ